MISICRPLVLVFALGACASMPSAEERLDAACAEGDATSCTALERERATAAEPDVRPARDAVISDPSVSVGVSSDRGVGVGVGGNVGGGLRIGVGLGL